MKIEPHEPSAEELMLAGGDMPKPWDPFPLLLALARGKFTILLTAVFCAVAAWLYLLHLPPVFRAQTTIMPPSLTRVSASALLSQAGSGDLPSLAALSSPLGGKTQAETFVTVLSAWPIQEGMVKRFNLVQAYGSSSVDGAMSKLASSTILKSTRDGFITIGVNDTDRKRAAMLADGYVDQTREFLRGLSLSEASQRRAFFEAQLAKTKDEMTEAEANLARVQQNSGMIAIDAQARNLLETAASIRAQITAKEVQLESLKSYSTDSNPQVQMAQAELASLRKQLGAVESGGQGGLTGKGLSTVPGTELTVLRATRELKYQEGLYDLLMKQYEGSHLDEVRDAPILQVIEPARLPSKHAGPRRARDTEIAFAGGLLLGIAIVVARFFAGGLAAETRRRLRELGRAAVRP